MTMRSLLIKVDGFDNPQELELWVDNLNIKANLLLKENNLVRFFEKYKHLKGDKFLKLQS